MLSDYNRVQSRGANVEYSLSISCFRYLLLCWYPYPVRCAAVQVDESDGSIRSWGAITLAVPILPSSNRADLVPYVPPHRYSWADQPSITRRRSNAAPPPLRCAKGACSFLHERLDAAVTVSSPYRVWDTSTRLRPVSPSRNCRSRGLRVRRMLRVRSLRGPC